MNIKTRKLNWWIRIVTNKPRYIYYFGDFNNFWEAESLLKGYIKDLKEEGAEIVDIQINPFQPKQLTIPVKAISV